MRCRTVRRRLNNAGELDPEIIEHLKECRSCARDFEAAKALASSFNSARKNIAQDITPFNDLKSRLETLSPPTNGKEYTIMKKVKNKITSHPRYSFAVIAAICLFAFILLVPISYDKTIGYNLVMSDIAPDSGVDPATVSDVVGAIGYPDVQVSTTFDNKKLKIVFENLPSNEAVREITSAVASLSRAGIKTEVSPIVVKEMGTIYAQVKDKIDEIRIEAKGKSNSEIEEEIKAKLKERGYSNPKVTVVSNPDGQREIRIDTESENKTGAGTSQKQERKMILLGNEDTITIDASPLDKIAVNCEGKTDQQIEQEILDKLKAKGLKNPKVTITDMPDGKREIKVEVKDENKIDK